MTTENPIGSFLKMQKLVWDYDLGKEHTDEEFADYLGVSLGTYNKWKAGERKPTGLYIERIALRLSDEIYDVLEIEKPKLDTRLQDLVNVWGDLPNVVQEELWRTATQYREQQSKTGTNTNPVAKPARKRTR